MPVYQLKASHHDALMDSNSRKDSDLSHSKRQCVLELRHVFPHLHLVCTNFVCWADYTVRQ